MRWLPVAMLVACTSSPTPSANTPTRFRVMTYNVNFGLAGDRAGIDAIIAGKPDVVLLQETTPAWQRALVGALETTYPHHRFAHSHAPRLAGGLGILSRYPIASIDTLTEGGGPFFAWRVVLDAPGGRIQVLDLHLRPPMSDSGSWVIGYFSTRTDRQREAVAHVAKLDPALPALAVGDFNEEDDGLALAVFKEHGFTSALPQFQPAATTWMWPVAGNTLRFRLDHVLCDKHFRVLDAAVVPAGRSDHAPVWAELERR